MMATLFFLNLVFSLLASPILMGIINRTKAIFAGRKGPPVLQLYYDLWKCLRKGAVYSKTTTWIFYTSPVVGLCAMLISAAFLPFGGNPSYFAFDGDFILLIYLFGLMRFFCVLAALDTGSSFEGMGGSREIQFSIITEVALILTLTAIAKKVGHLLSLSGILSQINGDLWSVAGEILALSAASLLIVLLAENARIPVDDPNTHLELTMIHEVMVLDHTGPDLAMIFYSASLKFWILGSLLVRLLVPVSTGAAWLDQGFIVIGMCFLAVLVGIIESLMARLRMTNVPQLLLGAGTLSALALFLALR